MRNCQPVCKPGSVRCATQAGRSFLWDGRYRPPQATNPDDWAEEGPKPEGSRHPYSVLLPVGFARPRPLPSARCALTAPFHPDLGPKAKAVSFSVALSLGSPPPAINRHRFSMEPGLSSRFEKRATIRPTGPVAIGRPSENGKIIRALSAASCPIRGSRQSRSWPWRNKRDWPCSF